MLINKATSILQSLGSLYLFGDPSLPRAETALNIKDFYNDEELNELEINPTQVNSLFEHPIFKLNSDWDTFKGSMRNSSVGAIDALFSSVGAGLANKLGTVPKLIVTATSLASSLLTERIKLPIVSNDISVFTYAGRLLRSPLHMFDSFFSVFGESMSDSPVTAFTGLALGGLGLKNSIVNNSVLDNKIQLDYQTLSGTVGRSALHNIQSLLSSFANKIYKFNPMLGLVISLGFSGLALNLPKNITEHNISWKSINGILAQNIFHFSDSLYASLGSLVSKKTSTAKTLGFASLLGFGSLFVNKNFTDLISKKLVFTRFDSKNIRSMFKALEAIAFNSGTEFAKTKFALPFLALYSLLGIGALSSKPSLMPKLPEFKIPMNTVAGLLQRLPFDFVESVISAKSNQLAKKLPVPLMLLIGPALSFKLGSIFKTAQTAYNSSNGLVLKHMIHFWDNLLTSSGYDFGSKLMKKILGDNKEYSGSVLADGRWITKDGRIVSSMALAKQIN
jgi:hypothetical protein